MHHKALVNAARVVLTMLLIAGVVLLGFGIAIALLGDPPEVQGWLRTIFGRVFTVVAVAMAAVLGIPAGIGLWSMAGANAEDAVPALGETPRRAVVGVAIAAVVATAVVLVVTGSAVGILNFALFALVAMDSLGLAGAVVFSTHRGRAIVSAVALVLVVLGAAWVLLNAFIRPPF
jgi:hypothetical protein